MNRRAPIIAILAVCLPVAGFSATYSQTDIHITTEDQASDRSGDAAAIEGTKFIGGQSWTTAETAKTFGPGIGSVPVPNPELASYLADYVAWEAGELAKDAAFAAKVTAYGAEYTAYLTKLGLWKLCPFSCGSRPTPPTYPTRAASAPEPVAPPATIDVKGGATATVSTSGRVGFDVNYKLTAGSIDATLAYSVEAILPDSVGVGEEFTIATSSTFNTGTIVLDGPTAEASVDAILEASVLVSGQACAVVCTTTVSNFELFGTAESVELIKVTPNEITYLDGLTPDGVRLTTPLLDETITLQAGPTGLVLDGPLIPKPPGVYVDLAAFDFQAPIYSGVGGKVGNSLEVQGRSDYVDLSLDLDGLFAAVGLPTLGGLSASAGPLNVAFDAWDIDGIASLDVFQDVKLTPTLHVEFDFSKPVEIAGSLVNTFTGAWEALPSFKIFEATTFLPKFFVKAVAETALGLLPGIELQIDFLKGKLSLSAFNKTLISLNIGPLYTKTFAEDFGKLNLFSNRFDVAGFSLFEAQPFTLTPRGGSGGGGGSGGPSTVPLPAGLWLLLSGLLGMKLAGLRRRVARPTGGWARSGLAAG